MDEKIIADGPDWIIQNRDTTFRKSQEQERHNHGETSMESLLMQAGPDYV